MDGILGLTYFENNKNIVFDYKRNVILLNQDPISCFESNMTECNNLFFVNISIDSQKSTALIDTGHEFL